MSPKLRSVEVMDRRVFVWRKSTEEWLPFCTLGSVKTGDASIMAWGTMSHDGVGPLTVVQGSINTMEKEKQHEMYGVASTKS